MHPLGWQRRRCRRPLLRGMHAPAGLLPAALLLVRARPGVRLPPLGGAAVAARRPALVQRVVGDVALVRPQQQAAELRRHLVLQAPLPPAACPGGGADDDHPAAAAADDVLVISGGRAGRRREQDGGGEKERREARARRHCAPAVLPHLHYNW